MVICLERGADLHMSQLMPLPLTVSCFSKIQTGFTFLVPAHLGGPGKRAVKWVYVIIHVYTVVGSVQNLAAFLNRFRLFFCRFISLITYTPTLPE